MTSLDQDFPLIGHNRPADENPITVALEKKYQEAADTATMLLAKARGLPLSISDEKMLEGFAVISRQMSDHVKSLESHRVKEKEPYLRGGQAVDGWFVGVMNRLNQGIKVLHLRVHDYQEEKLERERRARAEQEARLRREADELEQQAARARNEKRKQELEIAAKLAAQRAAMAEEATQEKPQEIVRSRFEGGAMATMKRVPVIEVLDWEKVPLDKLRPYLKRDHILMAVKAWASATSYQEPLEGVSIELQNKPVIR